MKIRFYLTFFIFLTFTTLNPNLFAQEKKGSSEKFFKKKDQIAYTKNIVIIPRPGAFAAGMMFKLRNIRKLSVGPWLEYGNSKDDKTDVKYNSQSVGFLANYNFSKKEAFGSGPTILFISSIERYHHKSGLGSEMTMFDVLAGLYGGYQFSSKWGINGWLGIGYLGLIPFTDSDKILSGETKEVLDFYEDQVKPRGFLFPGLYLGFAF